MTSLCSDVKHLLYASVQEQTIVKSVLKCRALAKIGVQMISICHSSVFRSQAFAITLYSDAEYLS